MANTLKFGDGKWAVKEGSTLAYNDENGNFKPLPFTFDRAGSATRVNKQGLIEVVSNNEPRIDFLNDSKGALLLEPQRTNLIPYSEDFSDASWNSGGTTVSSNNAISPDGTQNADLITEDTSNGFHLVTADASQVSGRTDTMSVFIKNVNAKYIQITSNNTTTLASKVIFDIELGVIDSELFGTGTIENYGNGWYKLTVSGASGSTGSTGIGFRFLDNLKNEQYTGDGSSSVYLWGFQYEENSSYATSYIPTQGSIGTRVAESCVQTPVSGIIGQTEGTIYFESNYLFPSGTRTIANLYTSGSSFYQVYLTSSNQIRVDVNGGLLLLSSAIDLNANNKIAFAYKSGENALYVNGVSLATSTSTSVPSSLNDFYLGTLFNGAEQSGSFKEAKLYNTRLTDTELQQLTS